ncbi:hypothetical protein C9374_004791 [Naegleria lovaniensis]|uniref:DH domain-containing protein n=1 Tax=Naegleria lovaniensis TaxID=51637 RepID=A0AA88GPH7_NAELO|nr:uncharacterized protein C9374_004791 [Naegleria lovaniensis]KAG2382824.1 hypothetical protein C9374_004791 [Naegleria lovaniensis]
MPLPPIKPLVSTQTNNNNNNNTSPTTSSNPSSSPTPSHLNTPVTSSTTTTLNNNTTTNIMNTPSRSPISIPPVPPPRSKPQSTPSNILNNGYRRFIMMEEDDDQTSSSSTNTTTSSSSSSGGGGLLLSMNIQTQTLGSSSNLNHQEMSGHLSANLETMQDLTEDDEEEMISVLDDDECTLDSQGSLDMQEFTYLETGKFGSVSERKRSNCDLDSVGENVSSSTPGSESSTPRTCLPKLNLQTTKSKEQCVEWLAKSLPQLLNRYRFINYVKRDPSLKKARKRQELIKETVDTERTYVQNMKSFLNLYYQPLVENRDHGKDVLKTQSDIQVLFSNINQIHTINQTLLTDLENANPEVKMKEVLDPTQPLASPSSAPEAESNITVTSPTQPPANSVETPPPSITSPRGFVIKRKDDPFAVKNTNTLKSYRIYENIGKPFEHLVPFLKTYTTYINNHDRATELFENLKKKKKFKEFLSECYQMQKGIKSDFCSFLILPIQRIPRYKMLLSEILCNTPEDHVEYLSLQNAVKEIEKIASYINEQKRNFDNVRYMYEVYGMIDSIYPGFVQPNRKFLRKGSLNVRYRQVKWQQRNSVSLSPGTVGPFESGNKTTTSTTPPQRALPSVPPSRSLPKVPPSKSLDNASQNSPYSMLAQVTGGQKIAPKNLYTEGRFTIYLFTDMLVLIEEKNEDDSSNNSGLNQLLRKATFRGRSNASPNNSNNSSTNSNSTGSNSSGDSNKSKYHQLNLVLGKNLHFIFFYFVDLDAFHGSIGVSGGLKQNSSSSTPVPPPKRVLYDLDECDIPIRGICKGTQFEYILSTSTSGEQKEWKEILTNCLTEVCNVKNYVKRGLVLEQPADLYKLGKERAVMQSQASDNLKFHQQMEQEQMLLQVRTAQMANEIQEKKELLAKLQQEIADLQEEKQEKEKRLEFIKEDKVQVRDRLNALWQELEQKDKSALKLLHDEKEAFKHIFGVEYGQKLTLTNAASTTSKDNNELLQQLLKSKEKMDKEQKGDKNDKNKSNNTAANSALEKKSSFLKSLIGDKTQARKVTIKHTQFIDNQIKAAQQQAQQQNQQ